MESILRMQDVEYPPEGNEVKGRGNRGRMGGFNDLRRRETASDGRRGSLAVSRNERTSSFGSSILLKSGGPWTSMFALFSDVPARVGCLAGQ